MKITFRWFGENYDSISLKQIRQIPNCTGIMGVLEQYAAGEVWDKSVIKDYVGKINDSGLKIEVIESVNVHEDIKLGLPTRDKYITNYCKTIENLAENGIKVIIYNFMPVFDWMRTDLAREIEDGSTVLYYDEKELEGLTPQEIVERKFSKSKGFTLPGWEPERMKELESVLEQYKSVTKETLLENYKYFLDGIIPVCEKFDVRMAVHPDDPAWSLFGIPRLANNINDLDSILSLYDSPANSLCLCTGSLGSSPDNDIPAAIRYFGEKGRIACAHIRNVKYLGYRKFQESSHYSGDGSLDMYEIVKAVYDTCPDIYIRPDHGRMIWDEQARPGYGLYDRALGIMYLNGLWDAISRS